MSETKRYYWFKMKTDFFDEMIIKFLRTQKKGDSMIIVFQRIMLFSLRNDGYIYYKNMFPTFEEELALAIGEKVDIIRKTLEILIKFGAIEKTDESTYYIKMLENCIGSETRDAERKRKSRQSGQCPENVGNFPPEIEKETEKETDSDKEKKTSSFSREKKGGSFGRKNNYYKNNSKPKKSTSYDIDEFLRENEAKATELVYVSNKEDGEP